MRTYRVTGMTSIREEEAVVRAIKAQLRQTTAVEASAESGEVRVDSSADPQIVIFAIDTAGVRVDEVAD